jgi:hypothetical protein
MTVKLNCPMEILHETRRHSHKQKQADPTFAPVDGVTALASDSSCRSGGRRRNIRRWASVHSDHSTRTINAINWRLPKRRWSMMKMVWGSFPDKLRWHRRSKCSDRGRDADHRTYRRRRRSVSALCCQVEWLITQFIVFVFCGERRRWWRGRM